MKLRLKHPADVLRQPEVIAPVKDPAMGIELRPLKQWDHQFEKHGPEHAHQDLPPGVVPLEGFEDGLIVSVPEALSLKRLSQPGGEPANDPDRGHPAAGPHPHPEALRGGRAAEEEVLTAPPLRSPLIGKEGDGRAAPLGIEEEHRGALFGEKRHHTAFHRYIAHDHHPTDQPRRDPLRGLPRLGHQHRGTVPPHLHPLPLQEIEGPSRP